MGPMNGVPGLEADDPLPSLLGEGGPELQWRVVVVGKTPLIGRTQELDLAAEQDVALPVDRRYTWMVLVGRPVDHPGLALLVVAVELPEHHDGHGLPGTVNQGYLGALRESSGLLLVDGYGDGQAPGEAAPQAHILSPALVLVAQHEPFEGAEDPGRDHLQVGSGPRAQGHLRQIRSLHRTLPALLFGDYAVYEFSPVRGYGTLCSQQDLLLVCVLRTSVGKSRSPRYGWDRMRRQLVVVGQTVLVGGLELLGQLGVPALGRLYARALLGIGVPSVPVVPSLNFPRFPGEGAGRKRHLEVLAVGGEHPSGVLRKGHRIDDGHVLPRVRRVPEHPVQILVPGLLQREIRPHLVQRHQHVLGVPHDEGVDEPRGKLGTQYLLGVISHVFEEDALFARPEHVLGHPLITVLGLRLGIRKAVAHAIPTVVVRGRKRLVQYLEVVPLYKHPLERRGYGTGYSPQRNGFALCHMRLSVLLYRVNARPL